MQPRLGNWPAGGTSLSINATSNDLWPDRLDSASLPESFCKNSDALECTSGDWKTIKEHMRLWNDMSFVKFHEQMPTFPNLWSFPCPHGYRQLGSGFRFGRYSGIYSTASMPQFAISEAAAIVSTAWAVAARNVPGPWRYKYRNSASYAIETKQAIVLTFCFPLTTVHLNATTINFPSLAIDIEKQNNLLGTHDWIHDLTSPTAANANFRAGLLENPNITLTWFPNPFNETCFNCDYRTVARPAQETNQEQELAHLWR
jgi:hypothetical protein